MLVPRSGLDRRFHFSHGEQCTMLCEQQETDAEETASWAARVCMFVCVMSWLRAVWSARLRQNMLDYAPKRKAEDENVFLLGC